MRGKHFIIASDHKPLEILDLNIFIAALRLQRILLLIQPYDIVIRSKPNKDVTIVDSSSRQLCSNAECIK